MKVIEIIKKVFFKRNKVYKIHIENVKETPRSNIMLTFSKHTMQWGASSVKKQKTKSQMKRQNFLFAIL